MKAMLLALALPFAAFGQETEIRFTSADPTPVFEITSLVVEPSGLSVTSDVTEVLNKMELLALPPATIKIRNGLHLLNWGGPRDFNRSFAINAQGVPIEVRLIGSREAAQWSMYVMGFGALAALVTAPYSSGPGPVPLAVPLASGAVSLAGLVGFALTVPRVEVHAP